MKTKGLYMVFMIVLFVFLMSTAFVAMLDLQEWNIDNEIATIEPTTENIIQTCEVAPTTSPFTIIETEKPTSEPTPTPTAEPTAIPTEAPTAEPTAAPTAAPTVAPAPVITTSPWKSLGIYSITAYCPCQNCSGGYGHATSTGAHATEGITVAVDPKVISYGSHLLINGHEYIAQDCGAAVKGKVIDIFFENHSSVNAFGRKTAEVFIKR